MSECQTKKNGLYTYKKSKNRKNWERANVQHLMDRSAFITGNAAAAAARRERAMSSHFQGGDPGSVGQAHAMSRLNHGACGDGAW